MLEELSRLLGLDGFVVKAVRERGAELDLEVELVAAARVANAEAGPPQRLSLDEAHHRRGHELATIVSDPDNRRVVEVLEGRRRRVVERSLRSLSAVERQAIRAVSIDPYDAYRQAVRQELPHAQIVCDPFHLVRGANEALDTVRRQRQRQPAPRRRQQGRKPRKESW